MRDNNKKTVNFFSIRFFKIFNKDYLTEVSIKSLYMNDKYIFIVIPNDKPSNILSNILKLRNKTKLRKWIFIFIFILYDHCYCQL